MLDSWWTHSSLPAGPLRVVMTDSLKELFVEPLSSLPIHPPVILMTFSDVILNFMHPKQRPLLEQHLGKVPVLEAVWGRTLYRPLVWSQVGRLRLWIVKGAAQGSGFPASVLLAPSLTLSTSPDARSLGWHSLPFESEKKNGLTHVPNLYQNKVITLWLSNKT